MKKNFFKRGMAGLLSLVMCLTALVGIGTTTAYAAGERAEVYLVSFPRSGDANIDYSGTWGHPNLRYMNGWHSGVANSLTGFTAISFCGLYLSIIFIILSCSVLAFEQLSAIDKNQKNYAVIDRLGVPSHRQASLIRRELSTVFLIPLLFPLLLTVLLITGAQFFFGEAILQQGLVPLYGLVTILLFCAIYLTYFGATMFLFKRVILRPEMR